MNQRYPIYALADLTVQSRDERKEVIVDEVMTAIIDFSTKGKKHE